MENKYKITIPEPCQEDWNKMSPSENGRFCSSCAKNVVDFTTMLPEEIQHYFATKKDNRICGKFRKSQLDAVIIQIPSRVLYSQTKYHKIFLLALFISMGTTLFSCADKEGNKQKIKTIEVVKDTLKKQTTLSVLEPLKDSLNKRKVQQTQQKNNQVRFKKPKPIKCGEVISNKKEEKINNEPNIVYEDNTVYGGVGIDVYPEYKGGMSKFNSFVKESYAIPKKARKINGKIKASFIIEKDGTLNDINIIEDIGFGTGEELIRVLKLSSKWYPAEEQGKKIRFKYESQIFIRTDTIKKIFNLRKITSRIDSIQIKRITKFKD